MWGFLYDNMPSGNPGQTSTNTKLKERVSPTRPGLPDFSPYKIPKREKYTKLPQTIPNIHKYNKRL
jgi:hypothetical protein